MLMFVATLRQNSTVATTARKQGQSLGRTSRDLTCRWRRRTTGRLQLSPSRAQLSVTWQFCPSASEKEKAFQFSAVLIHVKKGKPFSFFL